MMVENRNSYEMGKKFLRLYIAYFTVVETMSKIHINMFTLSTYFGQNELKIAIYEDCYILLSPYVLTW